RSSPPRRPAALRCRPRASRGRAAHRRAGGRRGRGHGNRGAARTPAAAHGTAAGAGREARRARRRNAARAAGEPACADGRPAGAGLGPRSCRRRDDRAADGCRRTPCPGYPGSGRGRPGRRPGRARGDGPDAAGRALRPPGPGAGRRAGLVRTRPRARRWLAAGGGMSQVIREPTIAMEAVDYDPFASGELACVVASTEPQRELWLADQLGREASLAFNLSVSLHLRGSLDRAALARALSSLVALHEALPATLDPQGELLCIRGPVPFAMDEVDLRALDPAARAEAVAARVRHSVEAPFDLARDLLFRAELLRLGEAEHRLVLSAHHVACDGWSWWIIVRELGALYGRHAGHGAQALPPAQAYSAWAIAEAARPASERQRDEAFWVGRFADGTPVLDLPTDHPRPARRGFASDRVDHLLDADLTTALRRL